MKRTSVWLAVATAGGVLAFGAVDALTLMLLQCAVAIIAAVEFWPGERPGLPRPALLVVLTLVILPLLQLIPLPASVWQLLAPARAAAYPQVLGPWNLASSAFPLTVQSYVTIQSWLRLSSYVLVFVLAFYWERRGHPSVLPALLTGLGLFEAIYGLVQYLTGFPYIFFYVKWFGLRDATGTYINHCKYAGLLGMVLPFLLAALLFPGRDHGRYRGRAFWLADQSFGTLGRVVIFAVVFLGLVFSKCRMAIIAITVVFALVAVLALIRRGKQAAPLLLAILIIPLGYALWVGIAPVTEHFERLDLHTGDTIRPGLWRDAIAVIRDNPWLGTGLGTYNTISPRYQTSYFQFHIDHAHNDYLEYAAELGVPAALLLFGSIWWLMVRLAGSVRRLQRRSDLVVATGCCGAILSLLLHSFTDFNLAIPANAIVFAWICGTATGLLARIRESAA